MQLHSLILGYITIFFHISSLVGQLELCEGTIKYPASLKTVTAPHVYFEGRSIPVEISAQNYEAHFNLYAKNSSVIKVLVVNGSLKPSCKDNGIPTGLKIPERIDYKYYICSQQEITNSEEPEKKSESEKCLMNWSFKEQELTNREVPQQTLIIMLNPTLIDLNSPTWDILSNFTPLPIITIKNNAKTIKLLVEQDIRLHLAALEMNTLHEPQKIISKINHGADSLTITQGCAPECD